MGEQVRRTTRFNHIALVRLFCNRVRNSMVDCTGTRRPNSSNCNLRYVVKKLDNEELVYFCGGVQLTGCKLVTFIKQLQNLTILSSTKPALILAP